MNKKTKTILWIGLFVLFIIGAYVAYNLLSSQYKPQNGGINTPSNSSAQNGQGSSEEEKIAIPDFKLTDMEGNEVTLEDFKGKPIVMNFWATWCGYCKEEMPYFETAYQANKDEVQFLMIDAVDGQRETVEVGKKFIEDNKYTFPVYFDMNQQVIYDYGVTSFPSTLFVDKDGYVAGGYQGKIEEETLLAGIEAIK